MLDPDFEAVLDRLSPDTRAIVSALREMIARAAPDAVETILWGSLSYHRPEVGGRVKGAVCLITVRRGQVRLEFIHGIRLADPAGLLCGNLRSKRHVPIASVAQVRRPELAALVRAAAAVDPTQWT
jgi:hypothetical protein